MVKNKMPEKVTRISVPKKSFLKLKKAVDEIAETIMIEERIEKSKESFQKGEYKSHAEIKGKFGIQ